ncbi:hypothetical protein [Crocinitomix catalasitica]|uniref:hypothetical protein n=1 Tax=Crocinitomix catalasitica TaxID=184607 RepID=UPI0004856120|nr:hypothetical protein [Crocinitomix catalasitica]
MRKYKINKDGAPKIPSKEAIEKYKDLNHLQHEYDRLTKKSKVPLYRNKKMFLVLLLILLVAYLVSQATSEKSIENEETNSVEATE